MDLLKLAWLAPLFMAWNQIKDLALRLSTVLVERATVSGQAADQLHDLLWTEWKPIPLGTKAYFTYWYTLREHGNTGPVVIQSFTGATLFRKGLRFVIWNPSRMGYGTLWGLRFNCSLYGLVVQAANAVYARDASQVSDQRKLGSGFYTVLAQGRNVKDKAGPKDEANGSVLRGSTPAAADVSPELSCLGVIPHYARHPLVGRCISELGEGQTRKPLERHYLEPSLQVLLQEISAWWEGKDWLQERGIPHRRGILLEGPPGCGKSSLVKALAQHFQLRLVMVDLATFSDFDLPVLRDMARLPSIFLFEDVDRVFVGDRNVTERGDTDKLSFDAFLNLLSGVDALNGLIVLTANHPDHLDPALIRPGRVDRRIRVPLLSADGRRAIAQRILGDCGPFEVAAALEGQEDQPAADFENRCIQMALKWYWETKLKTDEPAIH